MDEVKRIIILLSLQRYYTFFNWRSSMGWIFIARCLLNFKKFLLNFKTGKPALFICFIGCMMDGFGQSGITYDLKKPDKYENRQLGYEKTEQTKFKLPRHFIQNTITHYNYYFNINNKLNDILARAKSQNRDDYTQLLPFYNYSLDVLLRDKRNLDSSQTASILLLVLNHTPTTKTPMCIPKLRNHWQAKSVS